MISNNTFIEYAKVHENYYGTAEDFVTSKLREGINVFLEIDVQGFAQIQRTSIPNSSIFVLPPSKKVTNYSNTQSSPGKK